MSGQAQVFKTKEDALRQAFPDSVQIERRVLFLTDEQTDAVQKAAKSKLESKIITYYYGTHQDSVAGYAFFQTNVVRTKPETIMTVLNSDGSVRFVEILAFYEPLDYLPTPNWLHQFKQKILSNQLWPKRGIHNITGATLTAQTTTQSVRKTLAIYDLIISKEEQQ